MLSDDFVSWGSDVSHVGGGSSGGGIHGGGMGSGSCGFVGLLSGNNVGSDSLSSGKSDIIGVTHVWKSWDSLVDCGSGSYESEEGIEFHS